MWAYEIEPVLVEYLSEQLEALRRAGAHAELIERDFIREGAFALSFAGGRYSHAILNPPYKKIGASSEYRLLLRKFGIETVNLYTAFLGLVVALTKEGGEIVAIIPRSFCNGVYFRPFRKWLLRNVAIKHIHVFESRAKAFKEDEVLQENIIIHLERGGVQEQVMRKYGSLFCVISFVILVLPTQSFAQKSVGSWELSIDADLQKEMRSRVAPKIAKSKALDDRNAFLEISDCTKYSVGFRFEADAKFNIEGMKDLDADGNKLAFSRVRDKKSEVTYRSFIVLGNSYTPWYFSFDGIDIALSGETLEICPVENESDTRCLRFRLNGFSQALKYVCSR